MVHGGFISRRYWDPVVPHLAESFCVVTYDRRGHGESERPSEERSIREDVADLAALIEHLELAPAWVAAQSSGGNIILRLAGERPDLLRGIKVHEPGLLSLLADDPATAFLLEAPTQIIATVTDRIASGDHAGAAEAFLEEVVGPGLWNQLPALREDMIANARAFLGDANDPELAAFDLAWIRDFTRPTLLTLGDQSPPHFAPVVTKLAEAMPAAEVRRFTGAGHILHMEQPQNYVEVFTDFVRRHTGENLREAAPDGAPAAPDGAPGA